MEVRNVLLTEKIHRNNKSKIDKNGTTVVE